MGNTLSHVQLSQLSELIAVKMGLHFPESRWHDLERGLVSAAVAGKFATDKSTDNKFTDNKFVDVNVYCQSLLSASLTHTQIEELSPHLTVGETYFFREKPTFHALRDYIFPELIRARRAATKRLRIWSAGCCTGEEAYSSAILLSQLLPDLNEWSLSILATDINPQFLRKATEGVYGEWSFRDIPPHIKEHYFTPRAKGRFEILPSIKQRVKFAWLNLAEESYPSPQNHTSGLDLIFCRNVLMYFSPEQAKQVARRFYDSLAEGGWLVVSLGEASHHLFSDFKMVQFPNAILYQKKGASPIFQFESHQLESHQLEAHQLEAPQFENHFPERWREPIAPFALPPAPRPWRWRENELLTSTTPHRAKMLRPSIIESFTVAAPSASPVEQAPQGSASAVMFDQGRFADAEAQARIEVAEKPENGAALILLARICANQGRLDEALEWCKRSIAADRLNLRAHYLYATIQQARGEIDEAILALKRVLYLHPEFVLAHFALGHLARQQGKKREADKHFANMFALLNQYPPDKILPESDGLMAGRLVEMVRSSATDLAASRGKL